MTMTSALGKKWLRIPILAVCQDQGEAQTCSRFALATTSKLRVAVCIRLISGCCSDISFLRVIRSGTLVDTVSMYEARDKKTN